MLDFSVVIPARNAEKTIGRCIETALAQNYKGKYEVIVVDNDSKDATAEAIKKFPVKYLFCKKKGAGAARNLGVKNAKGKTIAFLDSDRFPEKNWLEEAGKFFKKNKGNIAAGKIKLEQNTLVKKTLMEIKMDQKLFAETGFGLTCNMFIKKKTFQKLGGFDERLAVTSEDLEFGERAFSIGEKTAYLEHAVVKYKPRQLHLYFKNEFRRGRALAQLNFLRKKALDCRHERIDRGALIAKKFLGGKGKGAVEIGMFLAIALGTKAACYAGQAFETALLAADSRRRAKLLG